MSTQPQSAPGITPDRIDAKSNAAVREWAKKLDVTDSQVIAAIANVGDLATDVEMHLKGTRSTSNATRVDEVGGA